MSFKKYVVWHQRPTDRYEMSEIKRVLFLSEACILDPNSGAAIEMLGWLNILQAHGYECYSTTLSIFDGQEEFPLQQEIFPTVNMGENIGKRIRTFLNNVEHNVFYGGSTVGPKIPVDQINGFVRSAAEDIRRIQPDVVLGYGGTNLVPLRRLAKSLGAKTIFNLHNASYGIEKRGSFEEIDKIITPSHALKELYEERFGFDMIDVVHNRVRRVLDKKSLRNSYLLERRRKGFVTMINPSVLKGGALFLQIANQAKPRLPETMFLAVESRGDQTMIENQVNGANQLSNIWWVQRQRNIKALYDRVSVLLVPSIYFEAAGRVIAEAQLAGIPVLATNNGGIPETLNGAGYLFDIPKSLTENVYSVPTPEEVTEWVDQLHTLMTDDKAYTTACKAALKAADSAFSEDKVDAEIVGAIESVLSD